MKKYTHLAHEEREKLYILHDGHTTLSKIARILKRSTSTISRELARNKTKIGQKPTYLPDKAANLAISRRKNKRKKIESDQHLKSIIIKHLQEDKWSPEIIAQRLKKFHQISISHESIYKFIYSIEGRHHMLYKHLMQQRYTRSISFGDHCITRVKTTGRSKCKVYNKNIHPTMIQSVNSTNFTKYSHVHTLYFIQICILFYSRLHQHTLRALRDAFNKLKLMAFSIICASTFAHVIYDETAA